MSDIYTEDILKELFNISVGKSASVLSDIINKKILLDVPIVKILDVIKESDEFNNYVNQTLDGTLMVSSICFKEKLNGKANLIFPADKMRTFINLCLNMDDIENCDEDIMFNDVDFDVIKEIGNIILNSLIGELANYLELEINYTLPEVKIFDKVDFKKTFDINNYTHTLLLYITFNIDDMEIRGAIIMNLTLTSINEILDKINTIEDDIFE